MKIFIGADHRGFELKNNLFAALQSQGHDVIDCGNTQLDPDDDFVLFAREVAEKVLADEASLGIAICGSGVGVSIAANRIRGIRCGLALSPEQVAHARQNDHTNMLALASQFMTPETISACVNSFLSNTPNESPRYTHRNMMLDED